MKDKKKLIIVASALLIVVGNVGYIVGSSISKQQSARLIRNELEEIKSTIDNKEEKNESNEQGTPNTLTFEQNVTVKEEQEEKTKQEENIEQAVRETTNSYKKANNKNINRWFLL